MSAGAFPDQTAQPDREVFGLDPAWSFMCLRFGDLYQVVEVFVLIKSPAARPVRPSPRFFSNRALVRAWSGSDARSAITSSGEGSPGQELHQFHDLAAWGG